MTDSRAPLIALIQAGDWEGALRVTQEILEAGDDAPPSVFFSRGKALLELGRGEEALSSVRRGRMASPAEEWGIILLFETLLSLARVDEAFDSLGAYINESSGDTEALKRLYVDMGVEHDRWQLALPMNERRAVILPDQAKSYAVAVQCFNKTDTLDMLFDALVRCRQTQSFNLVIFQDSAEGSAKEAQYAPASAEVREVIAKWLPILLDRFRTVEVNLSGRNRGTAPTCRRLLDFVSSRYAGFVFLEDDCILAEDALLWALHHLENNIGLDSYWFAACESVFFNSEGTPVSQDNLERLQEYARQEGVHSSYVELDFVPSTCFITTKEVWEQTKSVRSFPHGPESLNKFLTHLGKKTLSPVVPRARDIGMLHELGYSVAMLGKDQVKEVKDTYITSGGLFHAENCQLFAGNRDKLWLASCKMNEEFIFALTDPVK